MAGLDFSALPQQLTNGILLGAIYALIALGYTMVYGVLRLINFAHGEIYMLGAYVALFVSWLFGFTPNATTTPTISLHLVLAIMLLTSMVVCAGVGVLIERFAYRPMRNQPRIASLITAIGISLSLQYGGQLFLPVSPPPSISEKVNPFREPVGFSLSGENPALVTEAQNAKGAFEKTKAEYEAQKIIEPDEFNLSPKGVELRNAFQVQERNYNTLKGKATNSAIRINIPTGQLIMLLTVSSLMALLWFVVSKTSAGRAMRAVSHDFDSASLMGVNVNKVVTLTFIIGSALAGAGSMMAATFMGTPLTTFYGVQPGVKAFVAAVLGGIGNIPGAVLGGLLMGVSEVLVIWAGKSEYKDAIAFVILIAVLLFRPGGIMGSTKVEKV